MCSDFHSQFKSCTNWREMYSVFVFSYFDRKTPLICSQPGFYSCWYNKFRGICVSVEHLAIQLGRLFYMSMPSVLIHCSYSFIFFPLCCFCSSSGETTWRKKFIEIDTKQFWENTETKKTHNPLDIFFLKREMMNDTWHMTLDSYITILLYVTLFCAKWFYNVRKNLEIRRSLKIKQRGIWTL